MACANRAAQRRTSVRDRDPQRPGRCPHDGSDRAAHLRGRPPRHRAPSAGRERDLAEIEALGSDSPLPEPPADDADAAIAFTSGATGPGEGCAHLHRQLQAQRDALADLYAITDDDRLVAAFGVFALFGAALGISSAVPDMDLTAPATLTATALAEAVDAVDATLVFGSPAALANVAETRSEVPIAVARHWPGSPLLSTGAPVPPELLREVLQMMPSAQAHAPYGMTEVLPVADIDLPDLERAGSGNRVCVGRPVPGVTVAISALDAEGNPTGPIVEERSVTGEVCVRRPHETTLRPALGHRTGGEPRSWVAPDRRCRALRR